MDLDDYELEIIKKAAEVLIVSEDEAKEIYLASPSQLRELVKKEKKKWKSLYQVSPSRHEVK